MGDTVVMANSGLRSRRCARGLLAAGRPVVVLLSGGRDSTCLLDLAVRIAGAEAVSALHVNYALRDAADARRAPLRGAVRAARGASSRSGGRVARSRKPPRLGPRRALRRGGSDRDPTPGRRGRGPHRHRSGRDDPLPAGVLAEPPGAAGDARARGLAGAAPAQLHARADGGVLHGARAGVARGRDQRAGPLRPRPDPGPAGAGAAGRSTPPPKRTSWRWPPSCARRRPCSTRPSTPRSMGRNEIPLARLRELPDALRALVVQRLADGAAGAPAPGAARRAGEVAALPDHGRAALDLPRGVRAVAEAGVVRFERTPPLARGRPGDTKGDAERPL